MSNIYDNLNIVETAVTYDGRTISGSLAIQQNDFNLGTLNFLPDVPLEDQIEVERIFDTGVDSKFDSIVFTIADRRNMFVLPKGWYTINPQTKRMTINIPADTVDTNGKYYPESRTYMTEGVAGVEGPQRVDIPDTLQFEVTQFNYTPPGGSTSELVTREQDIVIIRRKTLSKDSIVTFAPGTRLTTTQLNLQFNQLKFILQELIAKVRNEIILKFDENAIDGPFLGNTDLKMSNRYIKNMNSPSILDINTDTGYPFVVGNTVTTGSSFAVNIDSLHEAIYFGTLHREGVTEGDAAFTGHFSAAAQDVGQIIPTNRKIINLADGTNNTDAATFGQVKNASNISTGTLTNNVLSNIPLSKLSGTSGQNYTLPVDALANSGVTTNPSVSAGSASATNTNNMVSMTVDNKGRVTAIASRNMAVEDLPTVSTIASATYGQSSATNSNNMLQIGVDSKGRITGISHRTFGNSDLPTSGVAQGTYGAVSGTGTNTLTRFSVNDRGIITSATHRNIEVNDLPTTSVTGAGTYGQATAGNSNNMLQVAYDARGRVTSISHRSMGTNDLPSGIPLSKLSGTNDGYTLPVTAIADTSITLAKINFGAGGTIPSGNLPSIDLGNINAANRGSFVLPEAAVPLVPSTNTAASTWNTLPVKDFKVDAKGRIFDVSHRAFTDGDIGTISANKITGVLDDGRIPAPSPAPTAGSYGSASNIPVISVDAKGRINTISTVTHAVANISDYTTATDTRIDNRALSRGTGSTYDAGSRKIVNVLDPTTAQDVMTLNYFNTNALVKVGSEINANSAIIKNVGTPAPGSAAGGDAVNFALLESVVLTNAQASGQLVGSTLPQVYRAAAPTPTANNPTTGWNRYAFAYVDGTNPLYATTSTMVLVEIEGSSTKCVPQTSAPTAGTVFNGYFYLDISGGTKTVYLYTNTSITGTNVIIRNFGLSRLVSGAVATTASTGLVSIVSGNDGGISVTGTGAISLAQATPTQIGGIKQGTGLTITNGVASVNLSNAVDSTNTATAASSQAVKTTYDYAVGINNSLSTTNTNLSNLSSTVTSVQTTANNALARAGGTMTGLVTLATSSSSVTPLRFVGGSAPSAPADGAVWYESNTLKMQTSSGTKTVAFTDSTLTGSAASAAKWTTGMNLALGGDLSGNITFDGSTGVTLNATIVNNSVALGTDTTGNYVATVTAGTGITVTGSGSENAGVTIINSDTGSAQNIFKTVTAGGTEVTAASNNSNLTLTAGDGISITGNNVNKTVTITNTATTPNVFGTVAVAGTNLVADSSTDTLTISQGDGITLTSNASTDTFTIANAGVTSVAGITNQVLVNSGTAAATGSITLSLPQAIHDQANVAFGSVTAKNLTLGSSNNTIISTDTNGNINLAPNGTGLVNITKALDVDGTLNVDGATTLAAATITGALSASNNITMTAADPQLQIGATGSNPVVIDRRTTAESGVAIAGDLEFRMNTGTKAFLIPGLATTTIANHEIITRGALNTTLNNYVTSANALTLAGGLNSGAAQALGTSTAHNTTIATNNIVRVTVGSAGGVTINSGGLAVTDGNITIGGTAGKVTAAASTVSGDGGKVLTTKDYVDGLVATLMPKLKSTSGVGQVIAIGEPGNSNTAVLSGGSSTLNQPQGLTLTIPGTSGQTWFWFVQNTNGTNGGTHTFCTLGPGGTVLTGHASNWFWSGFAIRIT